MKKTIKRFFIIIINWKWIIFLDILAKNPSKFSDKNLL